jgi:hypothetical protein
MFDATKLSETDLLYSIWRDAASVATTKEDPSQNKKSGVTGTESVGAGAISVAVLWHKVSQSNLLSCLRDAASEVLHRGANAVTSALVHMYGAAKAALLWTEHWIPSEPHQELIPWVAWFRPIQARNYVWEYTWPEEEYLHP